MRQRFVLFAGALLLGAASCDTSHPLPDPPPPDLLGPHGAWTLGPCIQAPGVKALFIGGPDFTCVSASGKAESAMEALGYLGGNIHFYDRGDGQALLVFDDPNQRGIAHRFDLTTGRAVRLSVPGTFDSQISRAGQDRFLVADYLENLSRSDTARFVFSFVEGNSVQTTLSIALPGMPRGEVSLIDGDYDAGTNTSAHLFVSKEFVRYILCVSHVEGSFSLMNVSYSDRASSLRYLKDGNLMLMDEVSGKIYSVSKMGSLAYDLGAGQDVVTARSLFEDSAGDLYTFTNRAETARVVRLLTEGGFEEVLELPHAQRYMYLSSPSDAICLREFRPFKWDDASYDEVVTVYSLRTKVLTTHRVALHTETYEFPRFACL